MTSCILASRFNTCESIHISNTRPSLSSDLIQTAPTLSRVTNFSTCWIICTAWARCREANWARKMQVRFSKCWMVMATVVSLDRWWSVTRFCVCIYWWHSGRVCYALCCAAQGAAFRCVLTCCEQEFEDYWVANMQVTALRRWCRFCFMIRCALWQGCKCSVVYLLHMFHATK